MAIHERTPSGLQAAARPRAPRARPLPPAGVAAAVLVTLGLGTVGSVTLHPDASQLVLAAYGVAIAVLAAVLASTLTRYRNVLLAQDAQAMAEALDRDDRLRLIVGSLHEGLLFQDPDLRIVEFNDAAASILGITDLALGRRPDELAPWQPVTEDGTVLSFDDHPAAVALRTAEPIIGMVLGVALPSGHTIWVRLNAVPVVRDGGALDGVITTFTDITTERTAQRALASSEAAVSVVTEQLSWQTLHDALTSLPNRAQLVERLTFALDRSARHGGLTAVLVLDIDRFKNVNDTMGHDAGDLVLVEVAARLRGAIRSGDVVARLAGDEFVVLAESLTGREEAVHMADRLRGTIAEPFVLPQGPVNVTACVGIAFDVDHRPSTLLRDADTALHKAKERGRDSCEVFDDSLRAETIRRVAAEQILRRALDEDGLRVHYQPIVDLRDGSVVAAEALLRILGPNDELLTPASFISIAEDTGLIVPVGAGVLDHACRQLAAWQAIPGSGPAAVSVNLSARQISTRTVPGVVQRTLQEHGIEASSLTLELTETTLIEAGHVALDTVEALHELGVKLAIDDFGTGYSSLSYLKRFPVDIVKVDRGFVAGLGAHQHDTEIVRAVLALGQSLGLTTVAEGVETEAQLDLLRELGCDCAQGFLLARPGPGDELARQDADIRRTVLGRSPVAAD
jgi:diguanylate cyclase (GGDEF)-like protein/PAS domain S-box-containing protein